MSDSVTIDITETTESVSVNVTEDAISVEVNVIQGDGSNTIGNRQWSTGSDIPTDPTSFPTDRFYLHTDGRVFTKLAGTSTWSVSLFSASSLTGTLSSSVTIDGGTI